MIFLSTTTISSNMTKIKGMKTIVVSTQKLQFLHVHNFEIILKFLTFDDLPHFLRACEKSKSISLRKTIFKLFATFYENQIQNSIEYLSSEIFHAKQQLKTKSKKVFEKFLTLKTRCLPKFIEHAIQTPEFRIVSHIDGFFSIEQKFLTSKKYSIVSIQYLLSQNCKDFNSNNLPFIKLLDLIFSSKHFITSLLHHENNIFMIFQTGEISFCGKTGKTRIFFQSNQFETISHFISEHKTYFISFYESSHNFVAYHIASRELFVFENSFLKSTVLNPSSKLDYDFFKKNGKFSGFVNSKHFVSMQTLSHLCEMSNTEIEIDRSTVVLDPNFVNEILNDNTFLNKL